MFSQFVSAAKGFFGRQDPSQEDDNSQQLPPKPAELDSSSPRNMVTATRSSRISAPEADESLTSSRHTTSKAKRKVDASAHENGGSVPKRKKQRPSNGTSSTPAATTGGSTGSQMVSVQINRRNESLPKRPVPEPSTNGDTTTSREQPTAKSTHVRFGSEEPTPHIDETEGATNSENYQEQQHSEESDEDGAPETLHNTSQLQMLRDATKKEFQARQRLEKSKKDKRRERDQRLKAQAVGKTDSRDHGLPGHQATTAKQDELRSESSATLQGSISKDPRVSGSIRSLPTLLPDEILNAEPSIPSLTSLPNGDPVAEKRISKKKKFLEKRDKHPKDIKLGGGTAIRVFDQGSNSAGSTSKLPPKIIKPKPTGPHELDNG